MSQATDLLNSLTDAQISAYSTDTGEEPHIVIGSDRFITVPKSLRRVAVQYDHDVETVTFDCPRYWDDLDMSQMAVYINYILSDGYADSYPAKNVRADGDIMHFEWTISRNVTQVVGNITFLVCIKKTVGEDEVNHWNSEICRDMYVSEGLETEEQIAMENTDLVTQLLLRMSAVEEINVQADEMEGFTSIATSAAQSAMDTEQRILETEARIDTSAAEIRNSYANAIKGKASGEIVRVDDVSPLEHDIDVWVHGKNILPYPYPQTAYTGNGGTFTVQSDGGIMASGTPTDYVSLNLYDGTPIAKSGNLVFSASGDYENVSISIVLYDSANAVLFNAEAWKGRYPISVNLDEYPTAVKWLVFIKRSSPNVEMTGIIYPQIELGAVATEYTPYVNPSTISVTRCGKSVFAKAEQVVSGVSKPWTSLLVAAVQVPPGNYVASCKFTQRGQDISTVSLSPRSYNNYTVPFGDASSTEKSGYLKKAFTVTEGSGGFQLFLYSNTPNQALTTECLFENIYVEMGSVDTGYSAYSGETYTPDTKGIVSEIRSFSPTMTIFTQTEGAIIEATYNRDTTKMFESYVLTDEAKSQIVAEVEDDMAEVLASLNSYATSLTGGGS